MLITKGHIVTALRNYEYVCNRPAISAMESNNRSLDLERSFRDLTFASSDSPFASHYYYAINPKATLTHYEISWLREHLPSKFAYSAEERQTRKHELETSKKPLQISSFVDRLARFIVAFTGGAFLVVPMLIMVLNQSRNKSVITVTVAVLIFAVVLAFGLNATNVETMVSTATYAAVLIVFVGTSHATVS